MMYTYSKNSVAQSPDCVVLFQPLLLFNLFLQTSYRYAFGELRSETLCPYGASAAAPPCRRATVYDRPIPFTTKIRDAEDSLSLLTLHLFQRRNYVLGFPMSDKNHSLHTINRMHGIHLQPTFDEL